MNNACRWLTADSFRSVRGGVNETNLNLGLGLGNDRGAGSKRPASPNRSLRRGSSRYFFSPGDATNVLTSAPSASFHTRTSPLNAPAATRLPSGLTATA
jgi:hypothetical protein